MGSDVYQDRDFARFYDWTHEGRDQDLPFYLDLARAHGRQLLEHLALGLDDLDNPGPADLDRHHVSRACDGAVDLGDAAGRQRRQIEALEDLAERTV